MSDTRSTVKVGVDAAIAFFRARIDEGECGSWGVAHSYITLLIEELDRRGKLNEDLARRQQTLESMRERWNELVDERDLYKGAAILLLDVIGGQKLLERR
jgi:hypothetical protein